MMKATTMQFDQVFETLLGLCASLIVLAAFWIVYILIQIEQNKAAFYSIDVDDKDPESGDTTIKSSLDLEIEMTEQDNNSPTKPQPGQQQQQAPPPSQTETQVVRKHRKRRIRPSFTIMQFLSVGALILLTYLLLVTSNAPMWLSAIGSLVVFGVFLRFQIGDEIRRQRWDRLSLLLSLFLFIASLLSMGVFAMKSLKKGEIYEGPARIVNYDASSYNNSAHDPSIRSDLHVQWGKDWGCPLSGSKTCVAPVQGAMCQVDTAGDGSSSVSDGGNNRKKRNLQRKKRWLLDEGDNVEDTTDEGDSDEADGDGDGDGDLEEENAELEKQNSDLQNENAELEQKIEELEAANEQEQEEVEAEKEEASEEVAEVEAEKDEAVAQEEEYEYEDAKIYDEEIISMEDEILEDEAENTSNSADAEEYEEEEQEYEEYETEISEEFDEVVDELESEEESYEESAEEHEEDAEIAAESVEDHEEIAEELESEASKDGTEEMEEEEEAYGEAIEEDMEYEEEEVEEEEGMYYEEDDWYWDEVTLEYDDDYYDSEYWDYDWDSAWGDYACEDLFNEDREGKSYDISKPAGGDDDWPYINIYGSCKTCDAYILDYFAEEAFERFEDYKKQSILFMTAAIGGFIVSLVGFIKYSLAPPAENEIQLLGCDGGVMA